jgi:hypothetical protein
MPGFQRSQLVDELEARATLGKVRWARKTVHVLLRDALPFAFAAMREPLDERFEGYLLRLGSSSEEYEAMRAEILALLAGGDLTTGEIRNGLGDNPRTTAFVNLMCDEGALVRCLPRAGWKSNLHTYRVFAEVFPDVDLASVTEPEGTAFMVSEYLHAFSPATRSDVMWWTGLQAARVDRALSAMADRWCYELVDGLPGKFIVLRSDLPTVEGMSPPQRPEVNLLPALDPYVMGYRVRTRMLDPVHDDQVIDPSGNVVQTVLVDGRIVGVWDLVEGKEPALLVHLLEGATKGVRRTIWARARTLGRFVTGSDVAVHECGEMTPLSERTRGSFMRPLREA